jgi:hypothetical protein
MRRVEARELAGAGFGRAAVAAAAVSGFLALAACGSDRDLSRNEQTVGGITIELGVIPAEEVPEYSTKVGDPNALHGGAPPHSGSHHIVVALFDGKSGARISDARVRAGVGNRSYDHEPDTWLEPMQIAGATTYGNFFAMPGVGLWRIHLEIFPAGARQPVRADFAYEHPGP